MKKFFYFGIIDEKILNQSYSASIYNDDTPTPLKLWDFKMMNESDINILYSKMISELANNKYKSIGVILHAYSMIISLSQFGIGEEKNIIETAERYIANNFTYIDNDSLSCFGRLPSYRSLGFLAKENSEFESIYASAKSRFELLYKQEMKKLLHENFILLCKKILMLLCIDFHARIQSIKIYILRL